MRARPLAHGSLLSVLIPDRQLSMPEIYDNLKPETELGHVLRTALAEARSMDACVGYFNLRGWKEVAASVNNLPFAEGDPPAVRLLIGMSQGDHIELRHAMRRAKGIIQRNDNRQASLLKKEIGEALRQQLSFLMPRADDEAALQTLRTQLAQRRVEVRMHLAFSLHAKLYLCHLRDRTAADCKVFLGSSNLTLAGLRSQGELNMDVLDGDATRKLQVWFDARWKDRLSEEANEILIALLDESWASEHPLSPYLIHLKLAYHLSRDARQGLVEFDVPEAIRTRLLEFQAAAVRITARRIMVNRGAMIADVVGLGKTLMATGVALVLQERYGYETLVIAPPNLVDMWQEYMDEYRVHGRVIRRTMVHRELGGLRRFRLVIIDEAHHLRTRTRQDYQAIHRYITGNEPKVLLLTATPFNRSMEDVANQIGLFLSDDARLPVRPEAALRREGVHAFKARYQLDNLDSLAAMRRSGEVEDWQRLLAHYLIRRTRSFIEEHYAQTDGQGRSYLALNQDQTRFHLPRRLPCRLDWVVTADDPAWILESEEVLAEIASLSLPRYRLQEFLDPSVAPDTKEGRVLKDFQTGGRGNLLGITKAMLYKRLSSGGYAFVLSLRRHLLHNLVTLYGVQIGGAIPTGTYRHENISWDDGEEDAPWSSTPFLDPAHSPVSDWSSLARTVWQQVTQEPPSGVNLLRSALFRPELQDSLCADIRILQGILERVPVWDAARDSKLEALANLINRKHGQEKVLVFTEFADTAQYLCRELKKRGVPGGLDLITGNTSNAVAVARRFSPRASGVFPDSTRKQKTVRVLIATDVLSEGLNLQDCSLIVNFDLPWAIIKLIQRAGRVDRIGQMAEEVTVYSLCPTEGVEAVIDLRGRIRRRLSTSAHILGSDERFFGDQEEEEQVRSFFDETSELSALTLADEEIDYASKAYEIWRQAQAQYPDKTRQVEALPDQIHATRHRRQGEGRGVMAYMLSEQGVDRVLFKPAGGPVTGMSPLEALECTACAPDTPGQRRQHDHYEHTAEIWQEAERQTGTRTAGSMAGVRKRAYDRLRDVCLRNEHTLFQPSEENKVAVNALHDYPLTEEANQRLGNALRGGVRSDEDLLELATWLHAEDRLVVALADEDDELRLVCSLGLA